MTCNWDQVCPELLPHPPFIDVYKNCVSFGERISAVMPEIVKLPQRVDRDGAKCMYDHLSGVRGFPVCVDGRDVVSGGTLAAQVLLAMAREWNNGGIFFELKVSDALRAEFECLGLDHDFRSEGLI